MLPRAKKRDFFSAARNALKQAGWYYQRLGIHAEIGYVDFGWRDENQRSQLGRTMWSVLPTIGPAGSIAGEPPLLLNYMISDLEYMIQQFRRKGIKVQKIVEYEYGRYASLLDPKGQRIEVWEPRHEEESLSCTVAVKE